MDLVYYNPPDRAEMFFHPLSDQDGLKSLRCRDHNVRRALCLSRSRANRSVSVSDLEFDVKIPSHLLKLAARVLPVPVGAISRTFSPVRIAGIASSWIGLASRKPSFSSLCRTGGLRAENAEFRIYFTNRPLGRFIPLPLRPSSLLLLDAQLRCRERSV